MRSNGAKTVETVFETSGLAQSLTAALFVAWTVG